MTEAQSTKTSRQKELTQAGFDALLAALHQDRERAAEQYEHIRRALVTFFAFRGAVTVDELADEAINRVALRLSEGAQIFADNPASYFLGVARNVWRETLASKVGTESLDGMQAEQIPDPDNPLASLLRQEQSQFKAQQFACLEHCLTHLTAQERELMVEYYEGTGSARIAHRQQLAEQSGISLKTLRNKTTLLRNRLANCARKCLQS